jgi:hypothetical protein
MTTPAQPAADLVFDDAFGQFMTALGTAAIADRNLTGLTPDQAATARDFIEIRDAFAVLRRELGLTPGDRDPGMPADPDQGMVEDWMDDWMYGPQDAEPEWATTPPGEQQRAGQMTAGEAAGSDRPGGDSAGIMPVGQALAAARAHAPAYQGAPEWDRIRAVSEAFGNLAGEIRRAAGSYFRELAGDVRARGFLRLAAARTCRVISHASRALAGRLDEAGHRGSPAWTAMWNLHRATANRAGQLMGHLPPGHSLDIVGDVSAMMTTMQHRVGAGRAAGDPPSGQPAPDEFRRFTQVIADIDPDEDVSGHMHDLVNQARQLVGEPPLPSSPAGPGNELPAAAEAGASVTAAAGFPRSPGQRTAAGKAPAPRPAAVAGPGAAPARHER